MRTPSPLTQKCKVFSIRVKSALIDGLEAHAKKQGISRNRAIELAIAELVKKQNAQSAA